MTPPGPPPFLLVHGAYHGGWCWAPIARLLRAHGRDVFTPTLTGLAERRHLLSSVITMETFMLDLLNVIEFEELEDIVLVGHSYGGRSITAVADRTPAKIRRLIYIDGGLPLDGLSRLDAMPPEAREKRIQSSIEWDGGLSVPPPPAELYGVRAPALVSWVNRRLTPQPLNAERTTVRLRNPIGNGRPATYVRCIEPALPSVQPSADYARARKDWRYLELRAGHEAILTHPAEVAQILLQESALG